MASLRWVDAPLPPEEPPPPLADPAAPALEVEPEILVEEDAFEAPDIAPPPAPEPVPSVVALPPLVALRTPLQRPARDPAPQEREPAPAPPPDPLPAPVTTKAALAADAGEPPVYPVRARRLGLEGRVVVRVAVGADGRAAEVTVAESSGHAMLDEAALAAVRTWTFAPALRDGRPEPGALLVPVRFALRDPS